MPDPLDVPVLIVGGGIVGLSASLFLSHHGVRSLLVERHAGTSIHPRSRSFNPRTMDLYRSLGLTDALRAAGADLSLSGGIYRGTSLASVIEPKKRAEEAADSGAARDLPGGGIVRRVGPEAGARVTQDRSEPLLLAAARAQPLADLRFYTECTEFAQDDEGVSAAIRDRESGRVEAVRARYVLGADGASSYVRRELGIRMTGTGLLGDLLNVLFEADLRDLVRGREFSLCLVERPEVRGLFTSINNSDRWVFHMAYDPTEGNGAKGYTADRCRELVQIALGVPGVDVKILSVLPWQSAVRVAETLRKGRVFLAGDAAHLMPPWGGQGANSGVADAHNLAWKLAAVLKGQAGSALLDTYEAERLPVGRLVAEESGAVANQDGLFSMTFRNILRTVPRLPRLLGLGYRYSSLAILPDESSQLFRIPWFFLAWLLDVNGRPGTRVPHLWVHQAGQEISTLDVCGKTFVLLTGPDGGAWRDAAAKTVDRLGVELTVMSVGPSGDLVDSEAGWMALAGISAKGVLLVRPDGFVAWRAYNQPGLPDEKLTQVLRQILAC